MSTPDVAASGASHRRHAGWPDRLGMCASTLCVVHCLITPALLSGSAVLAHFLPSEERVHRSLAVTVALLGALALAKGYRAHGRRRVVGLMAAGLGCIACTAAFGDRLPAHWVEVLITGAGSLLMIGSHRLNHTFCRNCACAAKVGPASGSARRRDAARTRDAAARLGIQSGTHNDATLQHAQRTD